MREPARRVELRRAMRQADIHAEELSAMSGWNARVAVGDRHDARAVELHPAVRNRDRGPRGSDHATQLRAGEQRPEWMLERAHVAERLARQ